MGNFISKNVDKLLVMLVMFVMYWGAWWGFHRENPNFANASIDLVKQLVASFLTLTVGARLMPRSNGGGGSNGNGKDTTVTTTVPPASGTTVSTTTSAK